MAGDAQGYAIRNLESQFRKISERFDMMGIKGRASATFLTPVPVSYKDRFSPIFIVLGIPNNMIFRSYSAFPIGIFISFWLWMMSRLFKHLF